MSRLRIRTEHLVAGLLIGLMSAARVVESRSDRQVGIDEPTWITSGYLTWQLVTQAAPPETWATVFAERQLGVWGNLNPPVGKLIIGMAVAHAKQPGDPIRYRWLWPYSYEVNLQAGTLPPDSLLRSVRQAMVPFGALALILVYLIGREVSGTVRFAPILAPVLLFSSETFRDYSTLVFTDAPQLAFTLAAVWLVSLWLRRMKPWLLVGALVLLGLACGTKLNAGVLVPATVIFVAILPAPLKKRVYRVFLTGTIPAAVFVVVNPYLWPQPFARTLSLIRGWGSFLREQQADPVHAAAKVVSRLDALDLVVQRVLLLPARGSEIPGFAGPWPHALVALLALVAVTCLSLAAFRWSGKRVDRRQAVLAFGLGALAAPMTWEFPGGNALVALLLALGAWRLVTCLWGSRHFEVAGYFTLVALTTLVATWLWLPFDWPRYYLPALGLTPVLGGVGAIEIEQALAPHRGSRGALT